MKDILLFDLDGTLFNTKPGIVNCVQYALADYGIFEDNPDNLEKFIGPPLHQSFQMFYGFDEKKARRRPPNTENAIRRRAYMNALPMTE